MHPVVAAQRSEEHVRRAVPSLEAPCPETAVRRARCTPARTELYERQRKRAWRVAEEADGGEDEEEEEEEGQHEAQELQGKLAFDIITSEDVWRHILEFL